MDGDAHISSGDLGSCHSYSPCCIAVENRVWNPLILTPVEPPNLDASGGRRKYPNQLSVLRGTFIELKSVLLERFH